MELTTLNSELHSRVEETAKANDDLQNIIVSTEIATVFVDKASQRMILIGEGGSRMKAIATQARHDMESLFGGKVFHEVWVRVKRGWADSDAMLTRLGPPSCSMQYSRVRVGRISTMALGPSATTTVACSSLSLP